MAATTEESLPGKDAMDLIEDGSPLASLTLLLAHGAGTPMDHPWLSAFAGSVALADCRVVRFEFPYMARCRVDGKRRPPDREQILLDAFREAHAACGSTRVVVGGKSMGGRMASMVADELGAAGLLCLGYPFHPPGRPDRTRTAHLESLSTPTLIVQGTKDPFGGPDDVAGYTLSPSIVIDWIVGAGHDLIPPRQRAKPLASSLDRAVVDSLAFLQEVART
ncbi:MAG: alpha/beta family hydrolase [Tepidiformaceae bacterium]